MGAAGDAKLAASDNRRSKQKEARSRRKGAGVQADLRSVDLAGLAALLIVAAEGGGAVRVGYTRDGGALALGCYAGEDYATEYVKPSEDFLAAVMEIVEAWWPGQSENFAALHQQLTQGSR